MGILNFCMVPTLKMNLSHQAHGVAGGAVLWLLLQFEGWTQHGCVISDFVLVLDMILLSVVMPQFALVLGCVVPDLVQLDRLSLVQSGFSKLTEYVGFCLIFPKNNTFDLWSTTSFKYNSRGDALPPVTIKKNYDVSIFTSLVQIWLLNPISPWTFSQQIMRQID